MPGACAGAPPRRPAGHAHSVLSRPHNSDPWPACRQELSACFPPCPPAFCPSTHPLHLPQATYYAQVPEQSAEQVAGTTGFVFLICLLANTMAMLLAWFFIL